MSSSIVNIGDKIDIRMIRQPGLNKTEEVMGKVYKSSVQDIKPDGVMEISMPMYGGKMVLLSTGIQYECLFFTGHGMYRCIAQVKERYKVEGLYMLLIEPKTPLEKFQRREYFRFQCAMDIEFCKITEAEAWLDNTAELIHRWMEQSYDTMKKGIAVDLSGGGIRFVAEEEGEKGEYVFVSLLLRGLDENHLVELAGRVLSCRQVKGEKGNRKYEYRVQFVTRDQKKRETIIKYIFEQERKSRKKG